MERKKRILKGGAFAPSFLYTTIIVYTHTIYTYYMYILIPMH